MNYCSKCGDPVEQNEKFCNKCGNSIQINNINQNNQQFGGQQVNGNYNQQNMNQSQVNYNQQLINNVQYQNYSNRTNNKKGIIIGVGCGLVVVALIFIISLIFKSPSSKYYFDTNVRENNDEIIQTEESSGSIKRGKYSTSIVYDNTYSGVSISNNTDAYKLIEKDSVQQKNNCPSKIKTVENDIISKYGITAVNLCEIDINFAKEIENVIKTIYEEYPSARGYITNLSLANVSMTDGYIAAFMPAFTFATSSSSSTYPWVIKTQILLNTSYFLNTERLQTTVTDGSNVGHFPPNATIYSPVAHEFGHYLSFLALMKNYDTNSILLVDSNNVNVFYDIYSDFVEGKFSLQMITEAYENYKKDTNTSMTMDEWRGTM